MTQLDVLEDLANFMSRRADELEYAFEEHKNDPGKLHELRGAREELIVLTKWLGAEMQKAQRYLDSIKEVVG